MLRLHKPHMVFLIETKIDKKKIELVHRRCGFMQGFEVSAVGSKRGCVLLGRMSFKSS